MTPDPVPADLLVAVEGGAGRITMNAPDRLNALDTAMLDAMTAAVERFDADPAVRCTVLTGAGRGFCAGANLAGGAVDDSTLFAAGRLSRAMVSSRTPVLTLVNGVAAGVGLSIALAGDYVLVAERASFVLAFSNIGLMPDGGGTGLVAANVGRARALRMALTAEKVPARVAESWGLVSEVVPDDEFDSRARELVERLSFIAPQSVARTKDAVNAAALDLEGALAREEEGQSALLRTADYAEGVDAFFAKRRPTFTGS